MFFRLILVSSLIYFLSFVSLAQTDSSSYRLNRLSFENIIEQAVQQEVTVVSASRSARRIEDLPVTIHVVTSDEILMNGYTTLVDVLKSLPSMKASQPGSGDSGEMFLMRGLLGNQYTKILVDNIPLKPSVSIGLPLEAQLPIRQAERIEIIYGPASAIYGADAAIGVINIITKKPKSSVFSFADIMSGTNNYRYTNFHVGGKAGRNKNILEYSFFGNYMEIDDMNIFGDSTVFHPLSFLEQHGHKVQIGDQLILPTQIDEDFLLRYNIPRELFFKGSDHYQGTISMPEIQKIPAESNLFGFNLRYKKWDITMMTMYRKTHSSLGRTPFLYKYNSPQYYFADRNSKYSINYNTNLWGVNSNTNLITSIYALDENSSFGVNFIPGFEKAYQFALSSDIFVEQMFTYSFRFVEILGGVSSQFSVNHPLTNYTQKPYDYEREFIFSTDISINTTDFEQFGYNPYAYIFASEFVQAYLNFDRLKVVGGIRLEHNSLFSETIFNPRLAVLYSFSSDHSVRLSTGKAYKPPAGNLLFQSLAFPFDMDGDKDSIYYALIPNPYLRPEYFESHELGYRGNLLGKRLNVDFALYYNRIENLIVSNMINPQLFYANAFVPNEDELARIYVNNYEAITRFYGVDLALTINNIYAPRNIKLKLSGSYTYGTETLPTGETIRFLRGIPNYMFKANLSGRITRKSYLNIENTLMSGWRRSFLPNKNYYNEQPEYPIIKGYFVTDLTYGYRVHNNLNMFIKVLNLFNTQYGGIDATTLDVDLRYNPQLGRNVRFGLSFMFN